MSHTYSIIAPAKVLMVESNLKFSTFKKENFDIAVFENKNVYIDTKNMKVKFEHSEVNTYCYIVSENNLVFLTHCSEESFNYRFVNFDDTNIKEIMNDTQKYEQKQAEIIKQRKEQQKIENDKKQAEEKIKKEQKEKELQEELNEAKKELAQGNKVSAFCFEKIIAELGIKIHPRTVGYIRNKLVWVSLSQMSFYSKTPSQEVFSLYKTAKEMLNETV